MDTNHPPLAPEAAADAPASSSHPRPAGPDPADLPGFEPVPLRYRADGLTPEKQREYVEALADTGVARAAAARIGVSEQAVNRVRRRADARAFDLACEAAQRLGARRLRSIAWERAIEGTVKRHHYHGEVRSEEIVYDNRLLVYLLGKAEKWLEPPAEAEAVAGDWERWADAIERGLPEPEPEPEPNPDPAEAEEEAFDGGEVWQDEDGSWWTEFPPPDGFDGEEEEPPGMVYRRTLSPAEQAVVDAELATQRAEEVAEGVIRRDLYFGFAGGLAASRLFPPREAETYETSAPRGAWPLPPPEE